MPTPLGTPIQPSTQSPNPAAEPSASSLLVQIDQAAGGISRVSDTQLVQLAEMTSAGASTCLSQVRLSQPVIDNVLESWAKEVDGPEQSDRFRVIAHIKLASAQMQNGKIVVLGHLNLCFFQSITSLPEGLEVDGELHLNGCSGLTRLPAGLRAGLLDLSDCWRLPRLPEGLSVRTSLSLKGCRSLACLPDNLRVGTLSLSDCSRLTLLPTCLDVEGNLDLRRCSGLTSLPEDLNVGSHLNLQGCTGLTSLPNWISTLGCLSSGAIREVDISNTALPEAVLQQLQQTETPGMRFIMTQRTSQFIEYRSLSEAIQSWGLKAAELHLKTSWFNEVETSELTAFLSRLHNTSEAKNENTIHSLKARIQIMLEGFASVSFRQLALTHIHDSLSSCDDRIQIVMDNIDIAQKVEHATQDSLEAVTSLGKSLYALELVDQQAQQHIHSQRFIDPIEAILALRIHLAAEFNLPIVTRCMKYETCANLTPAIIDGVRSRVKGGLENQEGVNGYLSQWEPMQQVHRQESVNRFNRELLAVEKIPRQQVLQLECPITGHGFEEIVTPILLAADQNQQLDRSNIEILDLDAVLRYWAEKGVHILTTQKMTLPELQRLMHRVEVDVQREIG